jgi:uncharacterized membrane protein
MNSKQSARNEQIRKMVFGSILMAIILIMTFIPQFGYITINAVPITIIHIPVIIGAIILGREYGFLLGLVFGLGSMTRSIIEYTMYAPFTNPLLSVLPRALFGYFSYDIYQFFVRLIKKEKVAIPFALASSTLVHSLLVIPLLYWFGKTGFFFFNNEFIFNVESGLFLYIWLVFTTNSLFEILLAIIIGTPIILILTKIKKNQK